LIQESDLDAPMESLCGRILRFTRTNKGSLMGGSIARPVGHRIIIGQRYGVEASTAGCSRLGPVQPG